MPRPRTQVSGDVTAGLLLGALVGGLVSRTPAGALVGGGWGGLMTGQTRQVPLALDVALQREMSNRGMMFVSLNRIGARGARLAYFSQGYNIVEAHVEPSVVDQESIDDSLFDQLLSKVG